ncbi:uncharacterized protein LOC131679715 [Topomyia yanbarensis]|uniref:uncharacterized protein LOC131679715 n=1 Tax=Topomyia yanbarensis TaxID=2498891 RepID=UPI00273AF941|nr:uncharacterized protein LOC131679715 [Topomyia yanbarensis]
MKHYIPVEVQRLLDNLKAAIVQAKTQSIQLDNENHQVLLVRADQVLLCYKYNKKTTLWQYLWAEKEIFSASDELEYCPWFVSEDGFIVLRNGIGLHIYKLDGQIKLNYLSSDGRYHDAYGWNQPDCTLLFGYFYSDSTQIGVMSRDVKGNISFEAVNKNEALKFSQLSIWKMETNPHVATHWKNVKTGITLSNIDAGSQQAFIVRKIGELGIYKLGRTHVMENVLTTKLIPFSGESGDQTFFGKISSERHSLHDILHFNSSGMSLYRYVPSSRDYQPILYVSKFSEKLGWAADHTSSTVLYDIDSDGLDELVFNGPSGFNALSISPESEIAVNMLSEKDFNVTSRHVRSFATLNLNKEQTIISISAGGIISFRLQLSTEDTSRAVERDQKGDEVTLDAIPQLLSTSANRSALPLHDQIDFKSFLYPRNPLLGTLDFSIPIVDVPNAFGIPISQSIMYREYNSADILGSGWALPIDCIYVDRRGSIFSIEHTYYLVKDGAQSQLKPKFEKHETDQISFTLDGSPEIGIHFFKSSNKWEIKTKFELFSYGSVKNVDWIQWEPGSDEWPVVSNTTLPMKTKPFIWFLSLRKDIHENFLKYIYEPEYSSLSSGKKYVDRLSLIKVSSNNGDFVRFSYDHLFNSKLLVGFFVQTASYTQDVKFQYSLVKSTPRLVSIDQLALPVLQFKYDGSKGELTEIHFPNGLVSKFSYSHLRFPTALTANKFSFSSDAQVTNGPNYTIISGKTESDQVRIIARDVVGSDTTDMSALVFPHLGKEPVQSYEVFTADHFFLVSLSHETHKELCLFKRMAHGAWSAEASCMKLSKESILMAGKSFLLIRNGEKLALLQLLGERWDVKPVLNNLADNTIVQAFSYAYVTYNDSELNVNFQDGNGTWVTKVVPFGTNMIKSSKSIFESFDTDETTIKNLQNIFMGGVLNTHHNAIIIRTLSLSENKLYSNMHFKIFNEKYELTNQETVTILVEDLDNYLLSLPPMNNNYFKIGYKNVDGKYRVVVKNHTGEILDEVSKIKEKVEEEIRKHPHASDAEKNKYRRESFEKLDSELQEIYKNVTAGIPFAIDPAKFGVFVNSDNVVSASNKFRFNGIRWDYERIPQSEISISEFSLKLGESITLTKSDTNATFKLYNGASLLWDLETPHGNDLLVNYPAFVGVQNPSSGSKIFTFANNKIHHLPEGEIVSRVSNYFGIVTSTDDKKSVTIRSLKSLLDFRQNAITKQTLVHDELHERSSTFEYDLTKVRQYSDGFTFTKSKVLPGGKPEFGWYEESFNLAAIGNSSKTVHNSKGGVVKILNPETDEKIEPFDEDTMLTDRLGRYKIADFRPYKLSQEVVSYYGFEPYEVNRIGVHQKWIFDKQLILREHLNHFLRLKPGSSITGQFRPTLKGMSYVASCWIRTDQSAFVAKSLTLKVISTDNEMLREIKGKIQSHISGWYYVEALYRSDSETDQNRFDIEVKNFGTHSLDVDHVLLTPLHFSFEINILEGRRGIARAVLMNSGLLRQTVLDRFGNVVAQISELGIVIFYTLKSKNSALVKNKKMISRVEMRPTFGDIEYSFEKKSHLKTLKYSPDIFSLRFLYTLSGAGSISITLGYFSMKLYQHNGHNNLKISTFEPVVINSEGECTVLLTKSHFVIWIDGHLILERTFESTTKAWSNVNFKVTGQTSFSEIIFMYDPAVKVFYQNKLGLTIQEITLKDHNTINSRQIVYDELDRPVLKTKWTELKTNGHTLLDYNPKLVTNLDSILLDRKVEGLADQLNPECEGYPFSWISYRDDPLETKSSMGLPGKPFSFVGPHKTKYGSNPNIAFLKVLFPTAKQFKHDSELSSGGSLTVHVTDKHENKVAELVKVVNHNHRLTTFEYDDQNRLICVLPPIYHRKINTLSKTNAFESLKLNTEEIMLRNSWGRYYRYDTNGRLVGKLTPDSGKQQFVYSDEGLLRFIIHGDREFSKYHVTYYTYGFDGKTVERGLLDIPRSELHTFLLNNASLPKSSNFIVYDFGENELVPSHRNRVQKSRKVSNGVTATEVLLFNGQEQLLNHIFVSSNKSLSIDYKYRNEKITEISYPLATSGELLKLSYEYTANGKIKTIRMSDRVLASMTYTASDVMKELQFEPNSRYTYNRTFAYNEPGYVSSIQDSFLTESIDYISNSYGGQSFGDGTVSATTFSATWHNYSNLELIKLKPEHFVSSETTVDQAKLCFESLKKLGYLDEHDRPQRGFYPASELQMSLICNTGSRANYISATLTNGFTSRYGHRYDYENHKQLIKAKYFQNFNEIPQDPLTEITFSKNIKEITVSESKTIWNILKMAGFIITDCTNSEVCHALPGKSLFHPTITNHINTASLEILFASAIKARKDIPEQIFSAVCKTWHTHDPFSQERICSALWTDLLSKSFVGTKSDKSTKALSPELKQALKNHSRYLARIVSVLYDNFASGLGKYNADVQSYDIDANGNHMHFYTGFRRYRLEYTENTNKISKVFLIDLKTEALQEVEFPMEHDFEGSVTKATHKGINKIVYDPLIKRASRIEMTDGRTVVFQYDVRGERLSKQVKDINGHIVKEKFYVRNSKGKCLVDYEVTHLKDDNTRHVRSTAYVYTDDNLIGFIRDNQFYSVFVDHEGSVRLVIRNGEVVAAYDYLPYGQLLRVYNSDPEGAIAYRYTGQEWDEETGLYNFHARLYDPEIGRFFQIDPKEQYASPYVYAGNSPISLVDPDGQFAFVVALAFAAAGAYLGASAANNSFNPVKWKLKPSLIGGIMGGVLGGLAPAGIGTSFAFLTATVGLSSVAAGGLIATTSVGFAYLSSAAANKNWNPIEWNWSSPQTWNSLFSGSLTGATLFAGVGKVHGKFLALSGSSRIVFVGVVSVSTGGIALYTGSMANNGSFSFWKWNWESPDTVWKVTMGASFGMSISPDLHKIQKGIVNQVKDLKKLIPTKGVSIEQFMTDAKAYFTDSSELVKQIKMTLHELSKQVVRYPGLAQTIAVRPKGTTFTDSVLETVESVLYEASKYEPLKNITGDLADRVNEMKNIDQREGLRRKRMAECCQLQVINHATTATHPSMLNSAARTHFQSFDYLFSAFNRFKQFFYSSDSNTSITALSYVKIKETHAAMYTLSNCYYFKVPSEPMFVKCFGWNSQYEIFSKIGGENRLVDDSFSYCTPIEYFGRASVACDGENSSLIFTPYHSGNILDHINGLILLATVTPTALSSIKNNIWSFLTKFFAKTVATTPPDQEEIDILTKKCHKLNEGIKMAESNFPIRLPWLRNIWADLREDITTYSKNSQKANFNALLDRINAFEDELIEIVTISYSHASATNSFHPNCYTFSKSPVTFQTNCIDRLHSENAIASI